MEVSAFLGAISDSVSSVLSFLSIDPLVKTFQFGLGVMASLLVFLVFFTTRDILQRTRSLAYQLGSIVLVALLPVVGFFLYLLIRPPRTLAEKELARSLHEVAQILRAQEKRREKIQRYAHAVRSKLTAKSTPAQSSDPSDRLVRAGERRVTRPTAASGRASDAQPIPA